jgi:hypothetical protein
MVSPKSPSIESATAYIGNATYQDQQYGGPFLVTQDFSETAVTRGLADLVLQKLT